MIFMTGFYMQELHAQMAISTSGGNASGSGGFVSYTIGQIVYSTNTGTNGTLAEGVQQPYEISVVTKLSENTGMQLFLSVYPNPTDNQLILKIGECNQDDLIYELYNINGGLLKSKNISGNETAIDMSNLVSATYYLKVVQSNNIVRTFKIIRN